MTQVQIDLSERERDFLVTCLKCWGGADHCTEELAVAMGFESVADLFDQIARIVPAIKSNAALSRLDWERTLVASEIAFGNTLFGVAWDWPAVGRIELAEAFALLESIRRAFDKALRDVEWPGIGTRPPLDSLGRLIRPDR